MAALRKSPVGAAFMRPWRIHTPPDFIRDQGAINGAPTQISRRGRIHAALAHSGTTIFICDQGAMNGAPA